MGKQRLTPDHVKLIRHLYYNENLKPTQITRQTELCSREHVNRIILGRRWGEVSTPTVSEGNLLYWKWVNDEI